MLCWQHYQMFPKTLRFIINLVERLTQFIANEINQLQHWSFICNDAFEMTAPLW